MTEFVSLRREEGRPIVSAEVKEALDAANAKRWQRTRGYVNLSKPIIDSLAKHLRRIRRSPEGEWLRELIEYLEKLQPDEDIIITRQREDV